MYECVGFGLSMCMNEHIWHDLPCAPVICTAAHINKLVVAMGCFLSLYITHAIIRLASQGANALIR